MVEALRGWLSNRLSCGHTWGRQPHRFGRRPAHWVGRGPAHDVGLDHEVVSTTNHHKMFDIVTADEDDASFSVDRERFDYCYPRWCTILRCLGRIGFVQTQTLPLNLRSRPKADEQPSRPSDAKQDERLVTFRPDKNNWAIHGSHPSAQLLCLARCIEVVHRWPIGVVVDGH